MREFRCRWGELVIIKKPKGISSDLRVTGEWAMIVRRFMNKTGVIKVYLSVQDATPTDLTSEEPRYPTG